MRPLNEALRNVVAYYQEAPQLLTSRETTWDERTLRSALKQFSSIPNAILVNAQIGFPSSEEKSVYSDPQEEKPQVFPHETLYLVLAVDGNAKDLLEKSDEWNRRHIARRRFVELHLTPKDQEATPFRYSHTVSYDDLVDEATIHGVAREQRQGKKIKPGHYANKQNREKMSFDGVRLQQAVKLQRSIDHTGIDKAPLPLRTKTEFDKYKKDPMQGTPRREKNTYNARTRKVSNLIQAIDTAQETLNNLAHRNHGPRKLKSSDLAVKLLDRLDRRYKRMGIQQDEETSQTPIEHQQDEKLGYRYDHRHRRDGLYRPERHSSTKIGGRDTKGVIFVGDPRKLPLAPRTTPVIYR